MTSYSSMGERGRSHAIEVNTRFKLRTIVEVRHTRREIPFSRLDPSAGTFAVPWSELIGECGHVVESYRRLGTTASAARRIGKRKRCHQCPRALEGGDVMDAEEPVDDTRQAAWKLFDGADGLVAYTVALAAEVKSLSAAVERVRAFSVDRQVPAVHGDYAQGYQAARRDVLSALDGEAAT